MTTTYRGKLLSTHPDHFGMKYTPEVMAEVAKTAEPLPVYINFRGDAVGKTTKLEVIEGELYCEFTLNRSVPFLNESFIVPDFALQKYRVEGRTIIAEQARLLAVSITLIPSDDHLSTITAG